MEVRLHCFAAGVNGVGEAEKILAYVARGKESKDVGVEPRGPRKVPQKVLKFCFMKRVCENIRTWVPP